MIHGNRVIFVPGAQIRHKMTYAKYLKADLSNPSADPTQPGNEPGEGSGSQTPPTGNETGGGSNTGNDQIGV